MPSTPTSRPPRTHVSVTVARGGGPGRAESAGEAVSTRGRHRTPDSGRMPDPERVGGVASPRAGVVPSQSGAPSRHTAPAQRSAPESLGGSVTSRRAPAPVTPNPRRSTGPMRSAPGHDEAVTDLVARPARRADDDAPDAPATGPVPGLLGLALGVLALVGAVVPAAAPGLALPVLGPLGTSPLALAALLVTGLLATACAGLGAGRHRSARAAAVTGLVVALAAVTATIVPLIALSL